MLGTAVPAGTGPAGIGSPASMRKAANDATSDEPAMFTKTPSGAMAGRSAATSWPWTASPAVATTRSVSSRARDGTADARDLARYGVQKVAVMSCLRSRSTSPCTPVSRGSTG